VHSRPRAAIFDHVARHYASGEIAHGAAALHLFREGMRTFSHLIVGKHFAWGERNESRVVYASTIVIKFLAWATMRKNSATDEHGFSRMTRQHAFYNPCLILFIRG